MFGSMVILFLLCLSVLLAANNEDQRQWDYFIFSQSWTVTFCNFNNCSRLPTSRMFTIHGLWPTIYPREQPVSCPSNESFNMDSLQSILHELNIRWPDMLSTEGSHGFWKHEWDRHGKCAAVEAHSISNQLEYFKAALDLNKKYSLLDILVSAGVHPNDSALINTSTMLDALTTALGSTPLIYCLKHHHKPSQLMEVRVCLDRSMQLMECPAKETSPNVENESLLDIISPMPCTNQILFPAT